MVDPDNRFLSNYATFSNNSKGRLVKEKSISQMIQEVIDKYNSTAISNAQKVRKFVILNTDFSVPGGELTETQKLRRKIVTEKYQQEIDSMYIQSIEI